MNIEETKTKLKFLLQCTSEAKLTKSEHVGCEQIVAEISSDLDNSIIKPKPKK